MPDVVRTPSSRTLSRGSDWAVWEVNCTLGPRDRPFEEQHAYASIAAVLHGTFQYRSPHGSALLYPGAFLLGNAGACFECSHDHGTGDRCIAFGFAPALFEEIAASAAGRARFRFNAARLPASPVMTPALVDIESRRFAARGLACEEFAIGLAERVMRAMSGHVPRLASPSARDVRRVAEAVRFIDAHHGEALDLARLAAVARTSKYHFVRTFRKVVACTPHQYLLNVRLRHSAQRLRDGQDSIATVAAEAGFGDLSTFYDTFRKVFGHAPGSLRGHAQRAS